MVHPNILEAFFTKKEVFHCLLEVATLGWRHRLKYSFVSLKKYTIVLNLHCREGVIQISYNWSWLIYICSSTLLILHLTTSSTSLSTGGGRAVGYHSIISLYKETKYCSITTMILYNTAVLLYNDNKYCSSKTMKTVFIVLVLVYWWIWLSHLATPTSAGGCGGFFLRGIFEVEDQMSGNSLWI